MVTDDEINEWAELAERLPRTAIIKAFNEGRIRAGLNAERYKFLRERPLDTIEQGGVFVGLVPENVVLNGVDLDKAVDDAMTI